VPPVPFLFYINTAASKRAEHEKKLMGINGMAPGYRRGTSPKAYLIDQPSSRILEGYGGGDLHRNRSEECLKWEGKLPLRLSMMQLSSRDD
jgi:hypothetical protein